MPQATIQLYNTLTAKKEILKTKIPGELSLYGCGPTVYGYTHVGNAFAALTQDLVVRVLELGGYRVKFARNITDVDDKIIKVSQDTGETPIAVAKKFADEYFSELRDLKARAPDLWPYATEHIPEMIKMIEGLITAGVAYVSETPFGNDVYFKVLVFKGYGKLSKRNTEEMLAGTRVEPGETKLNQLDFALWKAAKPGEPSWESPWGAGRPGWHIECSAMIEKHFPNGLDIHMGGLDLIFPHHENEIAQTEACCSHPLATYWVHNNLLTMGREKMSKSLGNIFTTRKFLDAYGPEVLRLMILQHHYRSPIDFSEESILRSEALLARLYMCKERVEKSKEARALTGEEIPADLKDLSKKIRDSLFDDFNSAKAIGLILKAARLCFKEERAELWKLWGEECSEAFSKIYGLLGQGPDRAQEEIRKRKLARLGLSEARAQEIESKLKEREQFRKNKDFAASDRLRQELETQGVLVMDGLDASTWGLKS